MKTLKWFFVLCVFALVAVACEKQAASQTAGYNCDDYTDPNEPQVAKLTGKLAELLDESYHGTVVRLSAKEVVDLPTPQTCAYSKFQNIGTYKDPDGVYQFAVLDANDWVIPVLTSAGAMYQILVPANDGTHDAFRVYVPKIELVMQPEEAEWYKNWREPGSPLSDISFDFRSVSAAQCSDLHIPPRVK